MKFRKLGRVTLSWVTAVTFLLHPGAFASANEGSLDREKLRKVFRDSGFNHRPMKMGEFAEIVARGLPADGAMIVRGLAKPFWDKPMPRVEISATPHVRMHIYGKKRIYTIEVINGEKDFARINGETITWLELVTPKEFVPHIMRMVDQEPLKKPADLYSWIEWMIPQALASVGGDDFFVSSTDTAEATPPTGAELLGPVESESNTATTAAPAAAAGNNSWFSGLGSTLQNNSGILTAVAVALGTWYIGSSINKSKDKEQVVEVEPTPVKSETRLPSSMDEVVGDTSRYNLVSNAIPATSSNKIINGVQVRSSDSTSIGVREKNTSVSGEAIF